MEGFFNQFYYGWFSMSQARTIITYLIDGNPQWIKTVEFPNRLIKGVSIPRKDFSLAIKNRSELQLSGVYFLLWEDDAGNKVSYIWQATVLGKRLNDHYKDTAKDFWNTAIAFTYKDWTLNESDINFLEKELIAAAAIANRYIIKNGNAWNTGLIQEHRKPDMDEFIEDLRILIAHFGFSVLKPLVSGRDLHESDALYYLHSRWSDARWLYTEEWFIVLKGSRWPKSLVKSEIDKKQYAYRNRPLLLSEWVIEEDGDSIVFLQDHLFTAPSSASNILLGRASNGRIEWKDESGHTLDENERA